MTWRKGLQLQLVILLCTRAYPGFLPHSHLRNFNLKLYPPAPFLPTEPLIFRCAISMITHFTGSASSLTSVGGGELYSWGSNENGCLGIGYVQGPRFWLRSLTSSFSNVFLVSSSTSAFHLPERVEGPFLRSPVEQVCTFMLCLLTNIFRHSKIQPDMETDLMGPISCFG